MSSSTDSSFWKEQASETRAGNASRSAPRISGASIPSQSSSGSWGRLATEQHLLERVAPEPESEGLQRDHLVGGDVPDVDVGAEVLDEPRLARLRRRLEDELGEGDLVDDLVDEACPHLSGRPVDAGGPAFAPLGHDLPGAGLELLLDPLDPLVGGVDDLRVLRADLGEDGEVAREVGDQLQLALAGDVDRPVRDLDVGEAVLDEPA